MSTRDEIRFDVTDAPDAYPEIRDEGVRRSLGLQPLRTPARTDAADIPTSDVRAMARAHAAKQAALFHEGNR